MGLATEVERGRSWMRLWQSTGLALFCLLAMAAPAAAAAGSHFSPSATPSAATRAPAMTTTLTASPSPATTNSAETLTATMHGYPTTTSGAVQFNDNAGAVPGCAGQPITASGSNYTATCQTSFSAASSPQHLTASFTPAPGLPSSISASLPLKIAKAATSVTTLAPSLAGGGSGVTYTAVVTPSVSGPVQPSGAVQFLSAGVPIAGCTSQALTAGPSSSQATCTVIAPQLSYPVNATYVADANFIGSTSTAQNVTVVLGTTDLATTLTSRGAVLNGYVYTSGVAVSWQFQYGRGSSDDLATPAQTIGAGQGTSRVSWPVTTLTPNTQYHYRLVVTALTGAGPPVISQAPDVPFGTPIGGNLLLTTHRLSVITRSVMVSQRCSSPLPCDGRFTITAHAGRRKAAKQGHAVVCTVASFRIGGHKRKTVSSRLKGDCRTLLRKAPHHRLSATLTSQTSTGQQGVSRKITLILR